MNEMYCGWLVCECGACWCNMPAERQARYRRWPPQSEHHRSNCWVESCRKVVEGEQRRCFKLKGKQGE
jgi:hypothetical protein